MDSFGSFSSNPNPAMGDQLGVVPADEDYFWDSELWRFLDSDDSAGGAAGGDAHFGSGGGDVKVEVEAEASHEKKRGKRKTESELGNHLSMERERRKKMKNMFSDLHAMLPQLPAKIDKSTIVEEAMKQIKTLEATLEKLQKQKAERARATMTTATIALEPSGSTAPHMKIVSGTTRESFLADHAASPSPLMKMPSIGQTNAEFRTWNSPNVALSTFGSKGYVMIVAPRRPRLFTSILLVLNKHKIDVEFAHSNCEENQMFFTLHTRLFQQTNGAAELPPGVSAEGVYKQAAQDLVSLVSS